MNEIFKEGDRVWCCMFGWGTVVKVINEFLYPIHVNFDCNDAAAYTNDGKLWLNYKRTLFFKEQQFDESRPEPEYEKGYYWVEDVMGEKKIVYYSATQFDSFRGAKVICKIEKP